MTDDTEATPWFDVEAVSYRTDSHASNRLSLLLPTLHHVNGVNSERIMVSKFHPVHHTEDEMDRDTAEHKESVCC